MKRIITALAVAGAFTASAAAFDNTTCQDFLVGTWKADIAAGAVEKDLPAMAIELFFSADGQTTMTITDAGSAPQSQKATWRAAPGAAADQCALTAVREGSTEKPSDTTPVTVKDDDTINFADFGDLKRQQ